MRPYFRDPGVGEKSRAREFYGGRGEVVAEKPIEIGAAKLVEVAYGWKDLRRLVS